MAALTSRRRESSTCLVRIVRNLGEHKGIGIIAAALGFVPSLASLADGGFLAKGLEICAGHHGGFEDRGMREDNRVTALLEKCVRPGDAESGCEFLPIVQRLNGLFNTTRK